jgi:hypothetical protein
MLIILLLYALNVFSTECKKISIEQSEQLSIYLPKINYISKYYIPLEQSCYELLKQNPIKKNINYLAVGWKHAIDHKKLNILEQQLEHINFNGGFTMCQHIHPEVIIPLLKKIGIDTLFTPHIKKNKNYEITLLPLPHFAMSITNYKNITQKDIYYSFIGCISCKFRKKIFEINHPTNTIIKSRRTWHFSSRKNKKNIYKREYENVLQRSRFSLCPRGTGPSTLRFWESLAVGAIPISIADELVLPSGINWQECVLFIPEKDILRIPEILAQISLKKEELMRQKCFEAYEYFSGDGLVQNIRDYYAN